MKAHQPDPSQESILQWVENVHATGETADQTYPKKFVGTPQDIDIICKAKN